MLVTTLDSNEDKYSVKSTLVLNQHHHHIIITGYTHVARLAYGQFKHKLMTGQSSRNVTNTGVQHNKVTVVLKSMKMLPIAHN